MSPRKAMLRRKTALCFSEVYPPLYTNISYSLRSCVENVLVKFKKQSQVLCTVEVENIAHSCSICFYSLIIPRT